MRQPWLCGLVFYGLWSLVDRTRCGPGVASLFGSGLRAKLVRYVSITHSSAVEQTRNTVVMLETHFVVCGTREILAKSVIQIDRPQSIQ